MSGVTITQSFTAYPAGAERAFAAGETVTDLDAETAALYVAKGLAEVPGNPPLLGEVPAQPAEGATKPQPQSTRGEP